MSPSNLYASLAKFDKIDKIVTEQLLYEPFIRTLGY